MRILLNGNPFYQPANTFISFPPCSVLTSEVMAPTTEGAMIPGKVPSVFEIEKITPENMGAKSEGVSMNPAPWCEPLKAMPTTRRLTAKTLWEHDRKVITTATVISGSWPTTQCFVVLKFELTHSLYIKSATFKTCCIYIDINVFQLRAFRENVNYRLWNYFKSCLVILIDPCFNTLYINTICQSSPKAWKSFRQVLRVKLLVSSSQSAKWETARMTIRAKTDGSADSDPFWKR